MKYQALFSLKNNEKVLIYVVCCSVIGTLKVKLTSCLGMTCVLVGRLTRVHSPLEHLCMMS